MGWHMLKGFKDADFGERKKMDDKEVETKAECIFRALKKRYPEHNHGSMRMGAEVLATNYGRGLIGKEELHIYKGYIIIETMAMVRGCRIPVKTEKIKL